MKMEEIGSQTVDSPSRSSPKLQQIPRPAAGRFECYDLRRVDVRQVFLTPLRYEEVDVRLAENLALVRRDFFKECCDATGHGLCDMEHPDSIVRRARDAWRV